MKKTKLFTNELENGKKSIKTPIDEQINKFIEENNVDLIDVKYSIGVSSDELRDYVYERALVTYEIKETLNGEDNSKGIRVLNDKEKEQRNAELLNNALSSTKIENLKDLITLVEQEQDIMTPSVKNMNNLDRLQDIKKSIDSNHLIEAIWARHGAWLVKQALIANGFSMGKE
ncbi:hypothetical protein COF68_06305 [Bacillus toyonensis]|uniref:hypothetical protein n=1 Tax=Bacillus toyonensis TaxID=155322 RepID=UPI000BFE1AFE|nr:hypothetical protein [Bacillus toyonensis]PHE64446.1 hypothetical protein COF68_06305 [Bacillus toyonensis]